MTQLTSQVVLVTGATDGLGQALSIELARRGARVLVHGRSDERGAATLDRIRRETGNDKVAFYRADFACFDEVRAMADRVLAEQPRLDALVNNAGLGIEKVRRTSDDGHELVLQVDYLSHYLLTRRLLDRLVASAPSRIVNVSSIGQAPIDFDDPMLARRFSGGRSYCRAKLAQVLMTLDLAAELDPKGVTVNALHPATYMPTKMVVGQFPVSSTLEQGVEAVLRLVVDPALDRTTGRFFDGTKESRALEQAYDEQARAKLRELSARLTGE